MINSMSGDGRYVAFDSCATNLVSQDVSHAAGNVLILRDRDAYGRVPLRDGDVLELVHFVGGG